MKTLFRWARRVACSTYERAQLHKIGQGPIGLIDVGSIGGCTPPWNTNLGKLAILMNFDPNERASARNKIRTIDAALWSEEATLPFYIYNGLNKTGSSLFKQNYEYVNNNWDTLRNTGPKYLAETWHDRSSLASTLTLRCRTLDDVLAEQNDHQFHFLKIDAQGAEGEILRGAEIFLNSHCVGLHLELFHIPLYKGIMLKAEIEIMLAKHDFNLVKEFPRHGSFDSQSDCVFLHRERGPHSIRDMIKNVYHIP